MTPPGQTLPQRRAWAGLAVALVAGFLMVAFFTFAGSGGRLAVEKTEEPTAVGDARLVAADAPLQFRGRTLAGREKVEAHDSDMRKLGQDDGGQFFVYRWTESPQPDALFLKMGDGEYLKIAP